MKMKIRLGVSLLIACLPWLAMAQNDDLYFVPKKEKKAETKTEVRQVTRQTTTTTTTTASVSPGTTVVVKDVTGKTRDIDEYNRRYTSRENTFSMQNDTLYIEENRREALWRAGRVGERLRRLAGRLRIRHAYRPFP